MSAVTVAVRGRYEDTLGRPAKGLVKFLARPAVIYDGVDLEFIVGQSRTVHLDAAGAFVARLQPTDDPDAIPTGWTYEVQEWIAGRLLRPAFDVDVPIADAASGIELGVVAPASPSSGDATTWVTLVAFNAAITTEQGARAAGDAVNAAAVTAEAGTRAAAITAEAAARVAADALNVPLTAVGAASGVAPLDAGQKVPLANLPAVAITETFVVASQAAMLALVAQRGDVAIRTDLSKSYVLATDSPTTLGDWKELLTPVDQVTSVVGAAGVVTGAQVAADPALTGAFVGYAAAAANPDLLIVGTIVRDANGAATSAPVVWPNAAPGTYTALVVSTAFPGAVDAYTITLGSPVTRTYTQPTVTRDSTGAVTTRPAIVVT